MYTCKFAQPFKKNTVFAHSYTSTISACHVLLCIWHFRKQITRKIKPRRVCHSALMWQICGSRNSNIAGGCDNTVAIGHENIFVDPQKQARETINAVINCFVLAHSPRIIFVESVKLLYYLKISCVHSAHTHELMPLPAHSIIVFI